MLEVLQSALTGSEVVYECRRCGSSVSSDMVQCPHCGTDSIARYRVE